MSVKDYLQEIHRLDLYTEQKRQEYETLKSLHKGISSVDYSKVRVKTLGKHEGFTRHSDQLVDLEAELQRDMHYFNRMRHERIEKIQRMEETSHMELLYKRYVEYKSLEYIAKEMGYSYKHIQKLHSDALKVFEAKFMKKLVKGKEVKDTSVKMVS